MQQNAEYLEQEAAAGRREEPEYALVDPEERKEGQPAAA